MPPGEDHSPAYSRPRPATPASLLHPTHERPDQPHAVQEQAQRPCRRWSRTSAGGRRAWACGDLPEELFRLFTRLLDADLSEELARELVERLRSEVRGGGACATRCCCKARIARMIEADIRVAGPIAVTPGRCRLAALVGPTGVGKTTTIAKLAANFRLKEKRRVGLITVDTYRIAAVEQLRTYADIIDLPMQVVSTPRGNARSRRPHEPIWT